MYKRKLMFLSDRYSAFELNLLDYLRIRSKAVVPGLIIVKNLIDDKLIDNWGIVQAIGLEGDVEIAAFVAVLTEKGTQFLQEWSNPNNESLTYGADETEAEANVVPSSARVSDPAAL